MTTILSAKTFGCHPVKLITMQSNKILVGVRDVLTSFLSSRLCGFRRLILRGQPFQFRLYDNLSYMVYLLIENLKVLSDWLDAKASDYWIED